MRRLIFAILAVVGAMVIVPAPVQAQSLTDKVRDAVIATVKEKTGRTLVINGELSFSMQPRPLMTAKQVILSNPEGFDESAFITMDQIDISFDLVAALTGNMVINGFVMENPKINLMINKDGRNNWSFGASALQAGVFEINNGVVTYYDARQETRHSFSDVNLKLSAPTISDTLEATGNLTWNDQKITLVTLLETPELFNSGKAARFSIKLDAARFSTDLSGNLSKQKEGFKLADIKLTTDDMISTGKVSFKYGKIKPYLAAELKMDGLNLTRYLGVFSTETRKIIGWSQENFDFSSLKALNGDFNLSADSLIYNKIKTGAASLNVKLNGSVLKVRMPKLALYEGTVRINLSVDGRKPETAFKFNGTVRNLKSLPFLRDAAGIDKIEGRTNLGFDLKSVGTSQLALMKALKGSADVNFRKGALRGINIAHILRSIQRGKTSGFAKGGKTPFGKFVAKFRFRKGIGVNKRLRMSGGEVFISGGGRVRMPNRTLGYRVHPSLVGRGGITVLGINVPIIISGPWANPRIYPDLPGILDAPNIALKGLSTVGKGSVKGAVGIVKKVTSPIGKIITAPFKKLF